MALLASRASRPRPLKKHTAPHAAAI